MVQFVYRSLLAVWVLGCVLFVAPLVSSHVLVHKAWVDVSSPTLVGKWSVTHILGQGCECSEAVAASLLERGPQAGVQESVVVIGKELLKAPALRARGFQVRTAEASELDTGEAHAVPTLIIRNQRGDALYVGGYSDQKLSAGVPVNDLQILRSLQGKGPPPKSFPIYGCVMSQKYQSLLDPLGIKKRE